MRLWTITLFLSLVTFNQLFGQDRNSDSDDTKLGWTVEHMPTFVGGFDSLDNFIKRNLIRPTRLKGGKVFVQFYVNIDGTTSDFVVIKGLTNEHNEMALQTLRKMPDWIPGTRNDVPVRVKMILPVKFE
jgi:protein TonB